MLPLSAFGSRTGSCKVFCLSSKVTDLGSMNTANSSSKELTLRVKNPGDRQPKDNMHIFYAAFPESDKEAKQARSHISAAPCHCGLTGKGCKYEQEDNTAFCTYCKPLENAPGQCSCPCQQCDASDSDWSDESGAAPEDSATEHIQLRSMDKEAKQASSHISGGPRHGGLTGKECKYEQEDSIAVCTYCKPAENISGHCACPCQQCDTTWSDWSDESGAAPEDSATEHIQLHSMFTTIAPYLTIYTNSRDKQSFRENDFASTIQIDIAQFPESALNAFEAQGRGFIHGHEKIISTPRTKAARLKQLFMQAAATEHGEDELSRCSNHRSLHDLYHAGGQACIAQTFVCTFPGGGNTHLMNVHASSGSKRLKDSQRQTLLTNLLHSISLATLGCIIGNAHGPRPLLVSSKAEDSARQ